MAKQKKGYEVRYYVGSEYSKSAGRKLYSRERAGRIVRFLKKRYAVAAFAAPMMVQASAVLAS